MSQIKTPIETLGFTVAANEPMQELAVDSFGPLPKDKYGNEYIIAIIDMFTRWIELYATPDGTAQSALRALIQHNKTFGQPYKILSDNGSQYVNEVIDLYLKMVGTEHLRIVPHSHEENSIVERSHKETLRHLRALVFDDKTLHNWSDHIDKVQRIMNASEHESIGVSPARLLFGNAIHLDKEVYQPITALHISDRQLASWADEQLTTQQRLLELASNRQHLKDLLHNIRRTNNLRDKNTTITVFPPGSYVKVAYPRSAMGQRAPNKLRMPWRGPYEVVDRLRGEYAVRDLATGKLHHFSEHLLQMYHANPMFDDPREVAVSEQQMYDIAEVLDIRGDPRRKSTVALYLKWVGYEDSPEWNSWNASFNKNVIIHHFLKQKGEPWRQLIPRQFR
jgi:hypothetical protein